MRKYRYTPLIIVLALVLAVVSFAFANTNTVPNSVAGDGSGTISGVTVSNIHYTLSANFVNITAVNFDVAPAMVDPTTATVRVSFDGGTTWSNACTSADGTAWACTITPVTVLSATNLRVVTAD